MSASVWTPGSAVSAEGLVKSQPFVATALQTTFTLTDFNYTPGTGSLAVFVSGLVQRPAIDFTETSVSSFTLVDPVEEGTIVLAVAQIGVTTSIPVVDLAPADVGAAKYLKTNAGGSDWEPKTPTEVATDIGALVSTDIGTTVQPYSEQTATVTASEAEMEAGTEEAIRSMSPALIAAAIAALAAGGTSIPAGAVQYFAMNSVPAGWLAADGSAVSRTTYADLFTAIGVTYGTGDGSTTFNLPDLRGYFLRGHGTNGDGAVSGAFGTKIADDNKSHTHTGTTDSSGTHSHTITLSTTNPGNSATNSGLSNSGGVAQSTNSSGSHAHTFTTAASGGTETKPKNIALLACIKA